MTDQYNAATYWASAVVHVRASTAEAFAQQ